MGLAHSPRIVTNGLVYAMDSANDKSHSGNMFRELGTSGFGSAADNNVTFPVQGTGQFVRLGYGQTFGGYTIQPNDVVYKYTMGETGGCYYHGMAVTIPSATAATMSFDYYVSPDAANYPGNPSLAGNYIAGFENYGGNALGAGANVPNSLKGVWQNVTMTAGPTSGYGTQAMFLYPGGCNGSQLATSGYILFRNPQVIFSTKTNTIKNFSKKTSATDVYDLSNNRNTGTINGRIVKVDNDFIFSGDGYINLGNILNVTQTSVTVAFKLNTLATRPHIIGKGGGSSGWIYLVVETNGTLNCFYDLSSIWTSLSGGTLSANTWYIVTFTYDGSSAKIYVNGNLTNSAANAGSLKTSDTNNFYIGTGPGVSSFVDGSVSFSLIYNRALSDSEVKQNYNALRGRFGL